jgi:tetratricopeptide (TPR) repeat protein
MKAGEIIEWTEGYAASSGDPAILHGEDYGAANRYVEDQIVNDGRIAAVCDSDAYFTPAEAEEIISYGSGWGALEELARKKAGVENWRLSNLSVFPIESVYGKPEEDFLTLLETGKLPARSAELTEDTVLEYCAGGRFIHALELVEDKDWYTWLQLGCAYYEAKTFDAARMAFEKSVKAKANPIAFRTLAWIYAADAAHRGEEWKKYGIVFMKHAVELGGRGYVRLIIDAIRYMQAFGTDEDIIELIESCGDTYKSNGRVALFYARSLTKTGRLEDAAAIMNSKPEVSDIQEGEVSTSAIWLDLYRKIIARDENRDGADIPDAEVFEKYPIPHEIDFRMS